MDFNYLYFSSKPFDINIPKTKCRAFGTTKKKRDFEKEKRLKKIAEASRRRNRK